MNELYFSCLDNKIFIDAGYRWAYCTLEKPGVVNRGQLISVEKVLNADKYWNPSKNNNSDWLHQDILPHCRKFLIQNRKLRIMFGEDEDFIDDKTYFDWKQIGFLAELSPRVFVEELGLKSWSEVENYISKLTTDEPWWWDFTEDEAYISKQAAHKKFETLVKIC
jgi:hypothetical protein